MAIMLAVLEGLTWLIIIDAVLSWVVPDRGQFPRNITSQITDPLYAPIRSILNPEKTGGLDLSPLIMLILLQVGMQLLRSAATAV